MEVMAQMEKEIVILIAEDDEGHAGLIRRNLVRAGVQNEILLFEDGQEIINFLFQESDGAQQVKTGSYILLLDIRMPKLDGTQVLERIKNDPELRKIPVIMLTTTDDPQEVENCHLLGCNHYITKPVEYEPFVRVIKQLGLFLSIGKVPVIHGEESA